MRNQGRPGKEAVYYGMGNVHAMLSAFSEKTVAVASVRISSTSATTNVHDEINTLAGSAELRSTDNSTVRLEPAATLVCATDNVHSPSGHEDRARSTPLNESTAPLNGSDSTEASSSCLMLTNRVVADGAAGEPLSPPQDAAAQHNARTDSRAIPVVSPRPLRSRFIAPAAPESARRATVTLKSVSSPNSAERQPVAR